tara:strand:+ start:209 stop:361 length:153 start_codon:yes stop_codon:yes gene_type:complete
MSNKEEVQGAVQTLQDSVNKLKEQLKEQEKLDGLLKMTPLPKEWINFLNQ